MIPWTANITKLKSDDGFWEIQHPAYQIGTEVDVDLDSRREQKFINRPTAKEFKCEIVDCINPGPNGEKMILPVELIDL